ncbi:MAG: HepT-like ribonuclease domain-containing protein [Thermomicrobiales bacterium]
MTNEHRERDPEHIRHALRCAARIAQLTAGGKAALFADTDKLDALCWNLYQLADVTGKISDAVKERHPEIPWRSIAGFRNFYAHAYEGIDPDRMWDDIQRGDVRDLAEKLGAIGR